MADKHQLYDDRIYWKMAVSLINEGFEIHYILIGDKSESGITNEGIQYRIFKVKTYSKSRYLNFVLKILNPRNNYKKLFRHARELKADVYHFHDLWINKIGAKLKNLNHKPVVFYDAREPYAADIISFSQAKGLLKIVDQYFAYFVDKWEKYKSKSYDLVISNEIIVRDNFRRKIGDDKAEVIYNYNDFHDKFEVKETSIKKYDFIYSGGITESRGALNIIKAIKIVQEIHPEIKVVFIGRYSPEKLKLELAELIDEFKLHSNVILFPFIDYQSVFKFYNESKIGLIPWLPYEALKMKLPIKIFEYMAFGLPIIGSNFGQIKNYIEDENSGILVDPLKPDQISKAMIELLSNDKLYAKLSLNGREATLNKFNWDIEFKRLLGFYLKFLTERAIHE